MLTADRPPSDQGPGATRNRRWWLAYHVAIAPFGILATTWLLAGLADSRHWLIWRHLDAAADMVELGTAVYAALAVSAEGGIRVVFWAIEQWRRDKERRVNEAQNLVLDELVYLARQQPDADVDALVALVDAVRPEPPARSSRLRRLMGRG